jgi:hypothetical protein
MPRRAVFLRRHQRGGNMKEDAAKPRNVVAGMATKLEDAVLDSIAGGEGSEYLTEEEAREIVRRNVEWNLQNGCATDPESEKAMVASWMKKPINRAELEAKGGIKYFFPK